MVAKKARFCFENILKIFFDPTDMSELIISSTDDLLRKAKEIEFRLDNLFNLSHMNGDLAGGDDDEGNGNFELMAAQLKEAEDLYRQVCILINNLAVAC